MALLYSDVGGLFSFIGVKVLHIEGLKKGRFVLVSQEFHNKMQQTLWLKKQKFILPQFWRSYILEIKGLEGPPCLSSSGQESVSYLSLSFWCFLTGRSLTLISDFMVYICLCLQFSSHKHTSHMGSGPTVIQHSFITSERLFPNDVSFIGIGMLRLEHIFCATQFNL